MSCVALLTLLGLVYCYFIVFVICICASHDPTGVKAILPNLSDCIFEFLGAENMKYCASIDTIERIVEGQPGV